jgi:hypothetical protein
MGRSSSGSMVAWCVAGVLLALLLLGLLTLFRAPRASSGGRVVRALSGKSAEELFAAPAAPPVAARPRPAAPRVDPAQALRSGAPTGATQPSAVAPPTAAAAGVQGGGAELDRYVQWLKAVEAERAALKAKGNVSNLQSLVNGGAQQAQQAIAAQMQGIIRAHQLFQQSAARTRPPVPRELQALDGVYLFTVTEESKAQAGAYEAILRNDAAGAQALLRTGASGTESRMQQVNQEWERLWKARGQAAPFQFAGS